MQTMKEAAAAFLANKRIAVTGVSRKAKDHGSNTVFKRLRDRGYEVFAVNPNADEVEGAHSYPDLTSIPGGVDARRAVAGSKEAGRPFGESQQICRRLALGTLSSRLFHQQFIHAFQGVAALE